MSIETIGTPSVTIDSERWPAVAEVPAGPVAAMSAAIADRLLRRAVARLPLRLVYPDGTAIGAGDATSATLTVHRPQALARRIGRHGLIGFGESYLAGDWSSEDLTRVLTVLAESVADLVPGPLQWLRRWRRRSSRRGVVPAAIRRAAMSPSTMICRTTCSLSSSTRP
ncbi:putative cyclopropane-fatty-acyl-phospholipid synthase ufaA1 [Mycobacterium kansasii]|uniref:Putative cyclopropane-fatty-acyl-phospholipid synthase ufaA1 n=1 Tax=Mycobacterium kansasii TaxID=1768 RepID=A0A1V3WQA4_MYCKA|nr:putative cyclopropane-fatty-acyl-phospholipid synthase ufaA1 [Mycobacterium kansasii]